MEENPDQLAKDLTCNCPRAAVAAKAVSQALAKSGNACGSNAGQALARESPLEALQLSQSCPRRKVQQQNRNSSASLSLSHTSR